jgi:hypothetical protein
VITRFWDLFTDISRNKKKGENCDKRETELRALYSSLILLFVFNCSKSFSILPLSTAKQEIPLFQAHLI